MNHPTTLDLTGGWENIVNNVERHNARLRFDAYLYQRKLKKKISKVVNIHRSKLLPHVCYKCCLH